MVNVGLSALAYAATSLGGLGASLEEANVAAELPTTGILAPAADEVSAMITTLFNGNGQWYQGLATRAQHFHQLFTQTLTEAGEAYHETDLASRQTLWSTVGKLEQPLAPLFGLGYGPPPSVIPGLPNVTNSAITLVMGGTTGPVVSVSMVDRLQNIYGFPTPYAIFTPEQFWPLTPRLGNLTLGQSFAQGTALLNTAIHTELAQGNTITVWGTSQSSTLITDELRGLATQGYPGVGNLKFVVTGDPNNPNGGVLERFAGFYIPVLDVMVNGATPSHTPYPVSIFTNQYDAVADFPQYPLNVVSDANAVFGFVLSQHDYGPPKSMGDYVQLPTSPGYTGNTTYHMSLTQQLPLLQPLRKLLPKPYGKALADLLQPDLRVIVDMGYGSDNYADVPTPASLLEIPNPFTIIPDLAAGAVQGPQAALVDLGLLPKSMLPNAYPYLPALNPDLNVNLGQSSVTGLSVLTGAEGALARDLGLIPPWDLA
jgi:hypothetical protein